MTLLDPINEAQRLRFNSGRPGGPIGDIVTFIENDCGIDVTIDVFPNGFAGMLFWDRGRQFIFINGLDSLTRQRFTAAHELGHHVLGHGPRADSGSFFGTQDKAEVDANKFASQLLLPQKDAREFWEATAGALGSARTAMELAVTYGVSFEMVRYHLQNAHVIDGRVVAELAEAAADASRLAVLKAEVDAAAVNDEIARSRGRLPRVPARVLEQGSRLAKRSIARENFQARTGISEAALDRILPPSSDRPAER